MPRRARRESATGFYHIVSRGLDRENIFGEKREKTRFLNLLKDNLKDCNIEIYAYCVMSNHFHLLAKAEKEIMPIFMAKVLGRYAKYYNYKHNRIGYVFENRYNTQCIEDERYFWSCLRYIHMNITQAAPKIPFIFYALRIISIFKYITNTIMFIIIIFRISSQHFGHKYWHNFFLSFC